MGSSVWLAIRSSHAESQAGWHEMVPQFPELFTSITIRLPFPPETPTFASGIPALISAASSGEPAHRADLRANCPILEKTPPARHSPPPLPSASATSFRISSSRARTFGARGSSVFSLMPSDSSSNDTARGLSPIFQT